MYVIFISDTHNEHDNATEYINNFISENQKDEIVMVHCGDFSGMGKEREIRKFNKWMGKINLPKEYKLFIAGNHDLMFQDSPSFAKSLITEATYCQDESVVIGGYKFYLSPWQPYFYDWAFNYHEDRAEIIWDMIPEDTDVLVTHGPPKGILDMAKGGHECGCPILLKKVNEIVPIVHAFGHIHEGAGTLVEDGTIFINASNLDEEYEYTHNPIIINLKDPNVK